MTKHRRSCPRPVIGSAADGRVSFYPGGIGAGRIGAGSGVGYTGGAGSSAGFWLGEEQPAIE